MPSYLVRKGSMNHARMLIIVCMLFVLYPLPAGLQFRDSKDFFAVCNRQKSVWHAITRLRLE